jgi:DNA-3-methyladenine glycosylase II
MGLSVEQIREGLDHAARQHPGMAAALKQVGYPPPRIRPTGYRTLLRTIVGQQVSVASADAVWRRLEGELGEDMAASELLARDFDTLRACGLSRQKQGYARSLCELVEGGALDLEHLPDDDEEAIAQLTQIKGIGRWSAEIYLLFAEGRPDIFPAGDLAVQEGMKRLLDLEDRPAERETRALAEPYAPHRGALAIFTWHYYQSFTL